MKTRSAALIVGVLAAPAAASAQASGDGYLFGRPTATLTLRGGLALPTANSDVFSFASRQLTLGKSDFASGSVGADLAIPVSNQLSLQFGAAIAGRTVNSEFRDWVDDNDLPIEQQTSFRRRMVTAGLKYHLTPSGRSVSRLAWIPSRIAPYVAAGGGTMWYRFAQQGDFVDFQTLDVFSENLSSSSWTPMAYAAGGVDFSLTTRLALTTEARYDYARAELGPSFSGFNRIDLAGVTANVGLTVRF